MKTKEDKSTQIPKDGESSNASRQLQLNTSLFSLAHSPLDNTLQEDSVSNYTLDTSLLLPGEVEKPDSHITGFSAPIFDESDYFNALKSGKEVMCFSCGRRRIKSPSTVMMICPGCIQEMLPIESIIKENN